MSKFQVKLSVIATTCAIVLIIVFSSLSNTSTSGSDIYIRPVPFLERMTARIQNEVDPLQVRDDKSYDRADSALYEVYVDLATEEAVRLADGRFKISDEDDSLASRRLFYSYAPKFNSYVGDFFKNKQDRWGENRLDEIKDASEFLMFVAEDYVPSEDSCVKSLRNYVSYVDSYYAAVSHANSWRRCEYAYQAKEFINKSDKYRKANPISNNKELMGRLRTADEKARRRAAENVIRQIEGAINVWASCRYEYWLINFYNEAYGAYLLYNYELGENAEIKSWLNKLDDNKTERNNRRSNDYNW